MSFDLDENSVAITKKVRELAGNPENWEILNGSVLDKNFLIKLGKFDIVYSWGVLHHTRKMWDAVSNAAQNLSKNGLFYIALYSKDAYVKPPFQFWIEVKNKTHFVT